jgi:hypothetical protein
VTTSLFWRYAVGCLCGVLCPAPGRAQSVEPHGQASAWVSANPGSPARGQVGLRYVPDLLLEQPSDSGLGLSVDLSVNLWANALYAEGAAASTEAQFRLYRAWLRLGGETFEVRLGLQKINFGSALLFRPLMWFDRIDPRDPLQLTDGVYAALARYYFLNNANIWLWGLYGNTDAKGWELSPTARKSAELGGRVQSPLWSGELGLSVHHRRADLGSLGLTLPASAAQVVPEDRIGVDGKWDIGIGAWFESVLIRRETDLPGLRYQRQWTLGADYTFEVGNGLYAAMEYFRTDAPTKPFGPGFGTAFTGMMLTYPVGILDQLSAILYRDWTSRMWYRIITWQRSYDNWSVYFMGFWNPETPVVYGRSPGGMPFTGTGLQALVVFNH